tara:strand:- start:304 stop:789 length:486 start_codon:yes stop_codon:yes gene_type:complete
MAADDIKDPRFVTSMFPLAITDGSIGFDSIRRDEVRKVINSHLKMLLLTNPGEIISDSKFGVGLYKHLFLLENEPQILNLQNRIESQISKYLPYLNNFRVIIDSSKVLENKLAVRILYVISETMREETLDFIVTEDSTTTIASGTTSDSLVTLGDILSERS